MVERYQTTRQIERQSERSQESASGPERLADWPRDMILVSNRLPVTIEENGHLIAKPSSGGLVNAVKGAVEQSGINTLWIGWPGREATREVIDLIQEASATDSFDLRTVGLSNNEVEGFYNGYANEVLWMMLHNRNFKYDPVNHPRYWQTYVDVNKKYTDAIMTQKSSDPMVWVHDYHLMLVPKLMREMGSKHTITFFLHTALSLPEYWSKLPDSERSQLFSGVLAADVLGLQTPQGVDNFTTTLNTFEPNTRVIKTPKGRIVIKDGHSTLLKIAPASIDYESLEQQSQSEEVVSRAEEIKAQNCDRHYMVTVSRLDPIKGITEFQAGLKKALINYYGLASMLLVRQLLIPSREGVMYTKPLRERINEQEYEINRMFSERPLENVHGYWNQVELLAQYRAARTGVVPSTADGMNLTAKEKVAASEDDGALMLSVLAGAYFELGDYAITFDPRRIDQIAQSIHTAVNMDDATRRDKMADAKAAVARYTDRHWAEDMIQAAREMHYYKNRIESAF